MNDVNEVTVKYEVDGAEIILSPNIVKNYIVGDANSNITLPEFKFFVEMCKQKKLNPFLKQIFLVKYGNNPAQIVISKDIYLRRCLNNPKFNGMENGIIVKSINNEIIERKGGFRLQNEDIVGAWCKIYRKDVQYPYYVSLPMSEMEQRKKDGTLNTFWASKPSLMAIKTVSAKAVRETFPEDYVGISDETETNIDIDYKESEPVVIEAEPTEEKEISLSEL